MSEDTQLDRREEARVLPHFFLLITCRGIGYPKTQFLPSKAPTTCVFADPENADKQPKTNNILGTWRWRSIASDAWAGVSATIMKNTDQIALDAS